MSEQTRKDISGFEYDWLACDADGQVGFFSTAGGGYAPEELLEDTDAYDEAIDAILAAPATTRACFAPQVAPGLVNTWQLMAERGLFAYDSDPHGGPYRLVAAPEVPVPVAKLPMGAVDVVRRVVFQGLRFARVRELTGDRLAQR
jgi:hypothetical protein